MRTSNIFLRRLRHAFLPTAGAILAVTGLAKAFSATGASRSLDVADPLIAIPFRHLMLLAGLTELFIAFFCLFTERRTSSLLAVAWLGTVFVAYRLGLWLTDWHGPCPCLGNLTGELHISQRLADNLLKVVLAYLLVGSYSELFWLWKPRKRLPRFAGR